LNFVPVFGLATKKVIEKKNQLWRVEREREVPFDVWGFAEEFQSPLWIPPPRR
jgi:hypothetical protein